MIALTVSLQWNRHAVPSPPKFEIRPVSVATDPSLVVSLGARRSSLVFLYGLIGIFGWGNGLDSPYMLLAMPIAVQEMVFALWLVVRGFNVPAPRSVRVAERQSVAA